ncbi:hypothetical protein [Delftia sp. JD2]|uniref:hypothetical protein n=1 Tax=Delftia sp. JD2 TaxID=469553 RepID=UPI0015864D32|nr:hypothetical protein [Delftia sp. JD2]
MVMTFSSSHSGVRKKARPLSNEYAQLLGILTDDRYSLHGGFPFCDLYSHAALWHDPAE